jgi:hypothetical protein
MVKQNLLKENIQSVLKFEIFKQAINEKLEQFLKLIPDLYRTDKDSRNKKPAVKAGLRSLFFH